ncbi:MAG: DUF935 family protein [Porticoccus sp.]|nr:DUF935 family protein [Porticoccus sp.]
MTDQISADKLQRIAKNVMSTHMAGRTSDPRFYGGLTTLPNPDPIIRKAGLTNEIFDAIESDAHVTGELRSIYGGLMSYELRVVDGVEGEPTGKDKEAWELCQWYMKHRRPGPSMSWRDTVWNMAKAVFHGFRAHELVWEKDGPWVLPTEVPDRPNRRFKFDVENNLRLLTKESATDGIDVEPYKFVLTRHMASAENPYGKALLSSCFWPYTFKHGGFKFFYKFCERYGLPWPVGKYPAGTPLKQQQELLDALLNMVEDGAATIPEGDAVELLEVSHQGELAQEQLIHLCNREMSKALTSQTLATEMRQVGSNAASKTHDDRQGRVQEGDRYMICDTFNEIFSWITKFNFGPDVAPPRLEFYKQKEVKKERAEIWSIAAEVGRPSRKAFHEEMNIPEADDDEDLLRAPPKKATPGDVGAEFSKCVNCGETHEFAGSESTDLENTAVAEVNKAIVDQWIQPAADLLAQFEAEGKSLLDFQEALPGLYGSLDDDAVLDITNQALALGVAQGMDEV